jgi:hypothetical protein
MFVVRAVALTWVYKKAMAYRYCQPMLAVCLYQDYGTSMFVQIWVLVE